MRWEAGVPGEVPHQVSPWAGRFVNRELELSAVSRILADGAAGLTRIAVFTGLPGVGKTVLARKVAEQASGTFPGGELFVEFGRSADGGFSVSDALASCLLALGVSAEVLPANEHDRVRLYRTRTAARPMLVVIDDVADPSEVTPLVPSAPGSVVLVTSTGRMTELELDGAAILKVEPLDAVTGVHLLTELCGSRVGGDLDAARRLVEVCGGLPVSLRAAARRLIRRRGLTVPELLAEIEDDVAAGRSAGETAVFGVIYRQFEDDVAALYRTVGVMPGRELSSRIIAAAHGVPEADAARLLEELVEAGMVQELDDSQFRIHELVKRHAWERAFAEDGDDERAAALRRAMAELLRLTAAADRAVLGKGRYRCTPHDRLLAGWADPFTGPERKQAALRWLNAERGTIAAAIRACAEQEWHELTWQLAESATALYVKCRYLVDWIETSEIGARAASLGRNLAAEARLRSFVSRPLTDLGELVRARHENDTAFALARQVPDFRLSASIHEMDGRLRDAEGDPVAALAAFRRAIELFRRADDTRGEAFVTVFAGLAQLSGGDPVAAVGTLAAAIELVEREDDPRMTGRAMTGLARANLATGNEEAARAGFETAIGVLRDSGDAFYEAEAQRLLASLFERAGEMARARDCLRRARDLHLSLGSAEVVELERELIALGSD